MAQQAGPRSVDAPPCVQGTFCYQACGAGPPRGRAPWQVGTGGGDAHVAAGSPPLGCCARGSDAPDGPPPHAPGPRGSGARVGAQGPGTPLRGRRALPGPCRCERLPRLHSSGLSLKTSFIFRTVLECWKGRDAGAGVPAPPRLPRCSSLLRLASPCPSERGRRAVPQLCLVQDPLVFT